MKTAFKLALASLAAHLVGAHYTFPDFIVGSTISSDWQYIRMTDNHYSNAPLTDVTSASLKCYESSTASSTSTVTVAAGSVVGFQANGAIYHPGYLSVYMCQTSNAGDEGACSGNNWFRVWEDLPVYTNGALVFPSQSMSSFTFTLPSALPPGQYLVRVEQIALHVASSYGGAQFYLSCAQINVTGGGGGTPGPLVAIPGVYTGYEPGILINIYNLPAGYTGYTRPGPAPWNPSGGSSPAPPVSSAQPGSTAKPTSSSAAKTTSSSFKTTSTSTPSTGGSVAHYGQCGGSGYSGPTTCASPYTCTVSNQYYSQCL